MPKKWSFRNNIFKVVSENSVKTVLVDVSLLEVWNTLIQRLITFISNNTI